MSSEAASRAVLSETATRRRPWGWRRVFRVVHRDVGYVLVGLTIVYAVSGIAVNHIDSWNPNYELAREEVHFDPVPISDRETMVRELVARLELPPPMDSFRRAPEFVELFYDGWSVQAHVTQGRAIFDRPRERPILFDFNYLHLNHAKGLWTWVADLFAFLLVVMALTGMFLLPGRKGFRGRGKWLVGLGIILPAAFLVLVRYLP